MAESRLKDIKVLHREKLSVRDFFCRYGKDLQLALHSPEEDLNTNIAESGIHRPGLAMAGYTKVYSSEQIQVVEQMVQVVEILPVPVSGFHLCASKVGVIKGR